MKNRREENEYPFPSLAHVPRADLPGPGIQAGRVDKNRKNEDVFPDGRFDIRKWHPPTIETCEDFLRAAEGMRLASRRVWRVRCFGMDDEMHAEGLFERAGIPLPAPAGDDPSDEDDLDAGWARIAKAYSAIPDDAAIPRGMTTWGVFVVEFQDGDALEIAAGPETGFRMSMNRIPPETEWDEMPNVDASVLFENLQGKFLSPPAPEPEAESGFNSFVLPFEDGFSLRFSEDEWGMAVEELGPDGEIDVVAMGKIRRGFHNREDRNFDTGSGAYSATGGLVFDGTVTSVYTDNGLRVAVLRPVETPKKVEGAGTVLVKKEFALPLLLALVEPDAPGAEGYGSFFFTEESWNRLLSRAKAMSDRIFELSRTKVPAAMLLALAPMQMSISRAADIWRRQQAVLAELIEWSRRVVQSGDKVRIDPLEWCERGY